MKNFYQVKIQEAAGIADEGCAFIELPTELLDHLGWKVGNNLVWEETEIGDADSSRYNVSYELRGLVLSRVANNQPADK